MTINKMWTIEDGIRAQKLNDEGRSAREIAAVLGRSRNSVIGWFHRHKIALDTPAKMERLSAKSSARFRKRQATPPKPPAPFLPKLFIDSKTKEPILQPLNDTNVSFMNLTGTMCRSVVGDPNGAETIFCGEKTMKAGDSWCKYHHSIYYGHKKEAQSDERKVISRGDRIFGTSWS